VTGAASAARLVMGSAFPNVIPRALQRRCEGTLSIVYRKLAPHVFLLTLRHPQSARSTAKAIYSSSSTGALSSLRVDEVHFCAGQALAHPVTVKEALGMPTLPPKLPGNMRWSCAMVMVGAASCVRTMTKSGIMCGC
jgi:hypothetical protein